MTVSESSAEVAFTANVLGARIEIYDDRDRLQDAQDDILRLSVSPGSYVVVATDPTGKCLEEPIEIGVGENLEHRFRFSPTASLLPIPGFTPNVFQHHVTALDSATGAHKSYRNRRRGSLVIMQRQVAWRTIHSEIHVPWKDIGFSVLDPGAKTIKGVADRRYAGAGEDYRILSADLRPGPYILHMTAGREQLVPVVRGWRTIVVVPIIGAEPESSEAAIVMIPRRTRWASCDPDSMLQAEDLYGALRVGEQISQPWLLERAKTHPDPVVRLICTSQLAASPGAGDRPETLQVLRQLETQLPRHPEVESQVAILGKLNKPLRYPPILMESYRRLISNNSGLIAPGSFAEHAGAAARGSGLWFSWTHAIGADQASLAASRVSSRSSVPLIAGFLDSFISNDTVSRARVLVAQAAVSAIRPLPFTGSVARVLLERLASWRSAGLSRIGIARLAQYGEVVGRLQDSTASFALLRAEDLAENVGVPPRLANAVQSALSTRLRGSLMSDEKQESSTGEDYKRRLPAPAVWTAIALLIAFGGLVVWMITNASSASELVWQRQAYIYGSVEAVVFAAAGALFGTQVKREQVAKAEERATQSQEEATEAKKSEQIAATDAANGRTQAAAIRGIAAAQAAQREAGTVPGEDVPGARVPGSRAPGPRGPGGTTPGGGDVALAALVHVADELFPAPGRQG